MSNAQHNAPASGVENFDWSQIGQQLDEFGYAILPRLLAFREADALSQHYADETLYRSIINMARQGFGMGEYRYYAYPLPALIGELRSRLYAPLALIANGWQARLGQDMRFPAQHSEFLSQCHGSGQTKPTPLILRYAAGDYNCLHQDLYGDIAFPLQVAVLLSQPGDDFSGGEFVLTEQRPRMQSRVEVVPLAKGDAVVFAVNDRPKRGANGDYRVKMRHGVSRIRSGQRHTLGVIFHDAQ